MNRQLTVLPVLAATILGLGACSGTTPGTGSPAGADSATQLSDSNTTPSSDSGAKLASTQPCDLLSAGELSQLGVGAQGKAATDAGARTCSWQHPAGAGGAGYLIAADIRDHQGIKDIVTDGYSVTDHPVGRHQGRLLRDATGGDLCAIIIGVTDSSRVDVNANTDAGTVDASCQWTLRVAPLVEARLP